MPHPDGFGLLLAHLWSLNCLPFSDRDRARRVLAHYLKHLLRFAATLTTPRHRHSHRIHHKNNSTTNNINNNNNNNGITNNNNNFNSRISNNFRIHTISFMDSQHCHHNNSCQHNNSNNNNNCHQYKINNKDNSTNSRTLMR